MASLKKLPKDLAVAVCLVVVAYGLLQNSWGARLQRTPGSERVNWSELDVHQFRITRDTFERRVNEFFSRDGEFWKYTQTSDDSLVIYTDTNRTIQAWTLHFARPREESQPAPRWTPRFGTEERPLRGLLVCLDPGHIGGEWSRIEERWFRIGDDPPVIEWDLNIITSRHIEEQLNKLGATVVWTKTEPEPVTEERPDTLRPVALKGLWRFLGRDDTTERFRTAGLSGLSEMLRLEAERSFYRFFEISARADVVRNLRPDVTLAIHYNAAPWGDPENPRLVNTNHLVLFVHGSYMAEELELEDHRFHLVRKVLENDIAVERGVAEEIGRQYARIWPQWRPANYGAPAWTMPMPESPYVYARNLLANRVFDGPVIFVEGPLMNAVDSYKRIQAGDYEGEKLIDGKMVRSIHREMAEAVVEGVKEYFSRGTLPDPPLPALGDVIQEETPGEG